MSAKSISIHFRPEFPQFLIPMGWLAKIVNGTASIFMPPIKSLVAEAAGRWALDTIVVCFLARAILYLHLAA